MKFYYCFHTGGDIVIVKDPAAPFWNALPMGVTHYCCERYCEQGQGKEESIWTRAYEGQISSCLVLLNGGKASLPQPPDLAAFHAVVHNNYGSANPDPSPMGQIPIKSYLYHLKCRIGTHSSNHGPRALSLEHPPKKRHTSLDTFYRISFTERPIHFHS